MATEIQLLKKKGNSPKTKQELYYAAVKTGKTKDIDDINFSGSTIRKYELHAGLELLKEEISNSLLNGRPFKVEGIGTFKLKVKAKSAEEKNKLTIHSVQDVGIEFTVDEKWKNMIKSAAVFTFAGQNTNPSQENPSDVEEGGGEGGNSSNKE